MARTADRDTSRARSRRRDPGSDDPVRIDEEKFEAAKDDPRTKAFAEASKRYIRRVRDSGGGD